MKEKNQIIQIGNVYQSQFDNPTRGRVYSVKGLAPTINTCGGGGLQPMILEIDESDTTARENGLREEDTQLV